MSGVTRDEMILYWVETSDSDYHTMMHLFEAGDYHWSLFMGHLVIEKLVKAVYAAVSETYQSIPHSHDLLYLAEKAELALTDDLKKKLAVITSFNMQARYPAYKKAFYAKCTREYCRDRLNDIEEARSWLTKHLPA